MKGVDQGQVYPSEAGSCCLLKIPELYKLASPAGDQVAFLITVIKCPREDKKNEDLFQFKITEGTNLRLLGPKHLGRKNIMAGGMRNMEEHFQLLVKRKQVMSLWKETKDTPPMTSLLQQLSNISQSAKIVLPPRCQEFNIWGTSHM